MSISLTFLLLILVLLGLEWKYHSKLARVTALLTALVLSWVAFPLPGRAMRSAIALPPQQRVPWPGPANSDYASGVVTMQRAVDEDIANGRSDRLIAVATLLWLALTPILRRGAAHVPARSEGTVGNGSSDSGVAS